MKMPQDFIDAINEAVKAVNPNAGTLVSGSFTLGSKFDELLHDLLFHYTPEKETQFDLLFEKHRDEIKKMLLDSAVNIEQRRMLGDVGLETFPELKKNSVDLNDFVKGLDQK